MFTDKILRNAVIFSVLLHAAFFLHSGKIQLPGRIEVAQKDLEVVYYKKVNAALPKALLRSQERIASRSIDLPKPQQEPYQRAMPDEEVAKKPTFKAQKMKPAYQALEMPKLSEKVEITSEKMLIYNKDKDLTNEPSYLNYYNTVRSRIQKAADYSKPQVFRAGDINMIFTILSSGDLKDLGLNRRASTASRTLQEHAIDSVYAAAPFPPFTSDIKEEELTLRLTISFQR